MNESDLVGRYLESQLSPVEERELLQAVEADPELRARFVAHVRLSVRLEAAYHAPRDPRLVERTKALLAGQPHRTLGEVQRRLGRRARARRWIAWTALAASLLFATLLTVALRPDPSEPQPVVDVRPEPPPPLPPLPIPEPPKGVPKETPAPVEPPKEKPSPVVIPEPPKPVPVPVPEPPPPPKPPPPRTPAETKVAAARIESVTGSGFRTAPGGRRPLRAGEDLLPGEGVQTAGTAVLVFADQTRLDLGAGTIVREVHDLGGKRLRLDRGNLRMQGKAMEITTPHAVARVVGTALRLVVNEVTRIDVSEGKVEVRRSSDGKTIEVSAGEYARVAPQLELAPYSKPQFIDLDEFGTGALCKPADGPVKRIYRDESLGATGGTCIAAPGVGTSLEGLLTLAPGSWHLWVRYRDTDQGPVSFQVLVDGRLAGSIAGEGFVKKPFEKWNWRRVSFESKGKSPRLTLRSMTEGTGYDRNDRTYLVANRWDAIVLTRDPGFDPDQDLPERKP